MVMKFRLAAEGLKQGTSKGSSSKDWRECLSFSWGVTQAGSYGAGASGKEQAGKVQPPDVTVTKEVDLASPKLFQHMVKNEVFKEVTIQFRGPGGGKYILKLTNAAIANIRRVSIPGAKGPCEQVEFSYEKVEKMIDFSRWSV